ncbi:hypothetical protein A2U01_0063987, partial [Trifolium medium]|nr:hypothetical protein [Trifolium medium]
KFWRGFGLKPPQNTLFCVLVARWRLTPFLRSPEVAGRGEGDVVARARQWSPVEAKLSDVLSPLFARRD